MREHSNHQDRRQLIKFGWINADSQEVLAAMVEEEGFEEYLDDCENDWSREDREILAELEGNSEVDECS